MGQSLKSAPQPVNLSRHLEHDFAVVRSVSCRVAFEKHSFPMPDVRPCLCSVGICLIESADLVPPDFLARTPVALSRDDDRLSGDECLAYRKGAGVRGLMPLANAACWQPHHQRAHCSPPRPSSNPTAHL